MIGSQQRTVIVRGLSLRGGRDRSRGRRDLWSLILTDQEHREPLCLWLGESGTHTTLGSGNADPETANAHCPRSNWFCRLVSAIIDEDTDRWVCGNLSNAERGGFDVLLGVRLRAGWIQ